MTIRRYRSPASPRTICATLAGWWGGADIAERLTLGLLTLADGPARRSPRGARRSAASSPRCVAAGLHRLGARRRRAADRRLAAAVHALIGGAGSMLAHAQFDDLAGETVATNLPGTDRERPNWRLKVGPDVAAAFAGYRAQAILAALAKGRTSRAPAGPPF